MATRTIVTSQPDVACDVCSRRLLRGEQPDIFLAAGRRLVVCELCAPRAVHEGWMRETEDQSVTLPPMRPRRGRSLFDRLRQVGRPTPYAADAPAEDLEAPRAPYDLFDAAEPGPAATTPAPARPAAGLDADADRGPSHLVDALAVFNASEYPRRVAGVARSLGPAVVNVTSAEHLASVVRIVVAWELCWYRYEVDLSEDIPVAVVLAQGTELAELSREERTGNALAHESGALSLAV